MEKELAAELIKQLDSQLIPMTFKFILVIVFFMLLKTIAENLVGFIMFRIDKCIAIGTPIEVKGKKGRVESISIFEITLKTDHGRMRIPTRLWRNSGYEILHDSVIGRKRRTEDRS